MDNTMFVKNPVELKLRITNLGNKYLLECEYCHKIIGSPINPGPKDGWVHHLSREGWRWSPQEDKIGCPGCTEKMTNDEGRMTKEMQPQINTDEHRLEKQSMCSNCENG